MAAATLPNVLTALATASQNAAALAAVLDTQLLLHWNGYPAGYPLINQTVALIKANAVAAVTTWVTLRDQT